MICYIELNRSNITHIHSKMKTWQVYKCQSVVWTLRNISNARKKKLGKYNLMGFEVIIYMPSENQTKKISLVL